MDWFCMDVAAALWLSSNQQYQRSNTVLPHRYTTTGRLLERKLQVMGGAVPLWKLWSCNQGVAARRSATLIRVF